MHKKMQVIAKKLAKAEKIIKTHRQQQIYDGLYTLYDDFQQKELESHPITADDEKVMDSMIVLIDYLVKDANVT